MALLSRVVSIRGAANLVTALNVAVAVGAAAVVLHRTRRLLPPVGWWIAAFALLSFGPLMSSVWWKQFNVIALVLALLGFDLVRQRRISAGAAAIGLSVAVKPIAILLPVAMLARRQTRRAGALAVAWIAGLNIAAQAMMATRAHDLAPLDPLMAVDNFLNKGPPEWVPFLCEPTNFAPGSLLCRAVGGWEYWTLQRTAVLCAVVLLGVWVIEALRGRAATSWEVFAFTCALSAMLTPLAWNHYQILLAPLFFLLLFRFAREGASIGAWSGLTLAFVLASLTWLPYGTMVGGIWELVSGTTESARQVRVLSGIAQFSQYILVATGVLWYAGRQPVGERVVGEIRKVRSA